MDYALRQAQRRYLASGSPDDAARYIALLERSASQVDHPYEIERTLVVSNSHITEDDRDYLEAEDRAATRGPRRGVGIVWIDYEFGWIIYLSSDDGYFQELISGVPPNIVKLMQLAKDLDCQWLRLDADGPVYEGLPTWDW